MLRGDPAARWRRWWWWERSCRSPRTAAAALVSSSRGLSKRLRGRTATATVLGASGLASTSGVRGVLRRVCRRWETCRLDVTCADDARRMWLGSCRALVAGCCLRHTCPVPDTSGSIVRCRRYITGRVHTRSDEGEQVFFSFFFSFFIPFWSDKHSHT